MTRSEQFLGRDLAQRIAAAERGGPYGDIGRHLLACRRKTLGIPDGMDTREWIRQQQEAA